MLDYYFIFTLWLMIYVFWVSYFLYSKVKTWKIVFFSVFYLYLLWVIAVTFFPIPIHSARWIIIWDTIKINSIPFNTIITQLSSQSLSLENKLKQVFWNIILFIPLGFFLTHIFIKKWFCKIIFYCFLFSLCIEIFQLLIGIIIWYNYRVIDIDDVILNTIGGFIGYIFYKISVMCKQNINTWQILQYTYFFKK